MSTEQLSLLVSGTRSRSDPRVRRALGRHFALVEWPDGPAAADQLLPRCHFDCVIVEAESAQDPVFAWVDRLRREASPGQVILVAGPGGGDLAAAARRAGAHGCVPLPLETASVRGALNDRLRHRPVPSARPGRGSATLPIELVGDSTPVRAVRSLVARIAPTPATVLVEGETGTGKELVARLLHQQSGRRGPFVPVNCGAIAPELMESELFGHAKGAFTGAHQLRQGLFLTANGGTLFLDEIAAMRQDLQVKLLRALEEGAIRPVGADREMPVDARIVASVQPGLDERVAQGQFREDLYYRLNVAHVRLPALRERPEDIPALVAHFMEAAAAQFGLPPLGLGEDEIASFRRLAWPGNVRELRNVVERAVLLGQWPSCGPDDAGETGSGEGYPLDWTMEQVKTAHMLRVLEDSGGNKSAAARRLGVSRKTVERKFGGDGSD